MAKTSGGIGGGAVQNLPVELGRDLPNLFRDLQKRVPMQQRFNMYLLFWGNEVLTEIGGVLEFYGKENAVRRQWEREEKEEKKENLEGKQRNSKNRTALDTQKEETMDWNTAFAVLRKFYEEKWDYLNGCPRNEKAWDEEGELQCKIYVSKKRGLDRDQRMEVLKLYETMEDRKVREAVRVICG